MKVEISNLYGLAVLEVVIYGLLMFWMGYQVVKARKKYGVKLPAAYENKENSDFNRYQRVHANAIEGSGLFFTTLLLSALATPLFSAIAGAVFIIGRYFYAVGYYQSTESRRKGAVYLIAQIYLVLGSVYFAIKLLVSQ